MIGHSKLTCLVHIAVCAAVMATSVASAQTVARLVAQPSIAAGLAAFPRLAPAGPEVARINDALSAADARVRAAADDCRAALAASDPSPDRHAWIRRVSVAMRGPRYLALVAYEEADCGGLHPDADRFALVYDLRTGRPPNWSRLLPKTLVQGVSVETRMDKTSIGMVNSPMLRLLYLATARVVAAKVDPRCVEDLQEMAGPFALWPDARQNGIVIVPSRLPHAAAACGVPVLLSMTAQLRRSIQPALLDAIDTAHRAGLYGAPGLPATTGHESVR